MDKVLKTIIIIWTISVILLSIGFILDLKKAEQIKVKLIIESEQPVKVTQNREFLIPLNDNTLTIKVKEFGK